MAPTTSCVRCKHSFPPTHFVGISGRPTKTCAACRKQQIPTSAPLPPLSVQTPSVRRSRSSSPPPSPPTLTDSLSRSGNPFASATSVQALEARLGRLEDRLDSRFNQLFDTIQTSRTSPILATAPPPPTTSQQGLLQLLVPSTQLTQPAPPRTARQAVQPGVTGLKNQCVP